MRFNFSALASVISLAFAPLASLAQQCPEASRFGVVNVVPTTLAPGDAFTVNVDLTCTAAFGHIPTYLDYFIEVVTGNNGHEPPILLARRTFDPAAGLSDTLSTELPPWGYFEHAQYSLVFQNSFATNGPNNNSVIIVGAVTIPITITGILI
ncbi:hypothetical protein DFH09DRAFT_1371126 [Mycena vulgaris]|nr:hypothetical protein DFH09DRAFT_1371126 [Mycena vulgaris]